MRYTVTRMDVAHRTPMLQLLNANLADLRDQQVVVERHRWSHERNPAGTPDTVVAVDSATGQVVGCGSAYPRHLVVDGSPMLVGIPADFAVSPAHRTGSAALMIQRALTAQDQAPFPAFIAFPNKSALPVLKRVGYTPVATSEDWVKPLRAGYKISARLPPVLAAPAACVADVALAAVDAWRRRGCPSVSHDILDRADERFDDLWARSTPNHPIAGVRASSYLNWRYSECTTVQHRFFCMLSGDTRALLGYIAFAMRGRKLFIADLFASDMERTVHQLLLHFSRAMRRDGFDSIFLSYAGDPLFATRLEGLGFFRRVGSERSLVAYTSGVSETVAKRLLDARNWHLFEGEMDV